MTADLSFRQGPHGRYLPPDLVQLIDTASDFQGFAAAVERLDRLLADAPPLRSLSGPPRDELVRRVTIAQSLRGHCIDELARHLRASNAYSAPAWVDRLPDFEGEVHVRGAMMDKVEWDFGKVRRRRPAAVLRPANTADVAKAVRFCRAEGIPLSPRAFAHSAGAQMQVEEGLVLDMKSMDRILELNQEWVDVEAGCAWGPVLEAAVEKGLSPYIVTDWLAVSVGGTISMGGFGFMSFWRGTQMDNLIELEVVTGLGEVVVCSRERNAELFDAVRGTHGKFGIITRARVPVERAPSGVRMVQACYGRFRDMAFDFDRFTKKRATDLIHAFAAEKSRASITTRMNSTDPMVLDDEAVDRALSTVKGEWVFNLELVDYLDHPLKKRRGMFDPKVLKCEPGLVDVWELSWKEFCFRLPPLILEEQFRGAAPHPELCVWVPMNDEGYSLCEREFERMNPVEHTGNGPILFFPLKTDQVGAGLFRLPDSDHCMFWGLLRRAEPDSAPRIAELMADNELIYHRCVDIGAVRYLPDTPPETPEFWKGHYGPLWGRLGELKAKYDPDSIFPATFGRALVDERTA